MISLASRITRLLALLAWFLAPPLAWSQSTDSGQWQILQARYGTASNNIDVTQRLRELARTDATFRVTNSQFGHDPAPGQVKMLRIYARSQRGETRTFEYHENDYVVGREFTGWSGGNWGQGGGNGGWGGSTANRPAQGGQWVILQARYGTSQYNMDVTQRLRELARSDNNFRVTNDLFGRDPHPGVEKSLRIYARSPSGATHTFEYPENGTVSGAQYSGWSSGGWGQGGWDGGWGDSGASASTQPTDRGQYQILEARYGTARRNIDVTQRLRELARSDSNIAVTNDTFGNDPDPGTVKTLRIFARGADGRTRTFEYGEEQVVAGTTFTGWTSGNWGQGGWDGGWGQLPSGGVAYGRVTIVSAQYGEGRDRMDVTERLRSMVRDGRLSVSVGNDSMGADPAPQRPKILWVTYYLGGEGQRQTKVREGERLTLP
jgi:hypothetical protein